MRMQIIGFEGSSGTSKAGKPYEIGQLHAIVRLAAAYGDSAVSVGSMGSTYRCPLSVIQKLKGQVAPFVAEVDIADVMKFGKREQEVTDVHLLELPRKAA